MNIAVVGKPMVGKTSLIRRLVDNSFSILYRPTLFTEYQTVIYNNKYRIVWWDAVKKQRRFDALILVTKDKDYSILKHFPPLPTWIACVECDPNIDFCAPHRVFKISNIENKGIQELLISILQYYTSTF